jgi:hypothetical protein
MRDTYRRSAAIQRSLMQFFPRLTGHRERHLNTLVALICGLAGGQRAHVSTIADQAPSGGADQERVLARFRRWLKQDGPTLDGWLLPVAKAVLETPSGRSPARWLSETACVSMTTSGSPPTSPRPQAIFPRHRAPRPTRQRSSARTSSAAPARCPWPVDRGCRTKRTPVRSPGPPATRHSQSRRAAARKGSGPEAGDASGRAGCVRPRWKPCGRSHTASSKLLIHCPDPASALTGVATTGAMPPRLPAVPP